MGTYLSVVKPKPITVRKMFRITLWLTPEEYLLFLRRAGVDVQTGKTSIHKHFKKVMQLEHAAEEIDGRARAAAIRRMHPRGKLIALPAQRHALAAPALRAAKLLRKGTG